MHLTDVHRLRAELAAYLDRVDIDRASLHVDPRGHTWLPARFVDVVEQDDAARELVASYVAIQRELYGASAANPDAGFTARVVEALSNEPVAHTERRTWILASFHALACGVAYVLVRPMLTSESFVAGLGAVHGYLDLATDSGLLWVVVGAVALVAWVVGSSATDRVGVALPRS